MTVYIVLVFATLHPCEQMCNDEAVSVRSVNANRHTRLKWDIWNAPDVLVRTIILYHFPQHYLQIIHMKRFVYVILVGLINEAQRRAII